MLAKNPLDVDGLPAGLRDEEIARLGLIAELDAINLYQQLAQVAGDGTLRRVLLDIAREEKTHVGEFLAILLRLDREQGKELEEGKEEVDELAA